MIRADSERLLPAFHFLRLVVFGRVRMERIRQLTSHLTGTPSGKAALLVDRPDDVVITLAVRSPLGRQKKGAFKDTPYASLAFALPSHTI